MSRLLIVCGYCQAFDLVPIHHATSQQMCSGVKNKIVCFHVVKKNDKISQLIVSLSIIMCIAALQ